jgi:hypothetical protein
MTLRFGTDTGCFSEEIIPSGMNKPLKNRIPDFAGGDMSKNQPAWFDLFGRGRWDVVVRRGGKPHGGSANFSELAAGFVGLIP